MIEKSIQYAPFHVINAFMRPDYRLTVVQSTFNNLTTLSGDRKAQFNKICKQFLQVPGFRNSLAAPLAMKIKPFVSAFEKYPAVVAVTLQAWSEEHFELRQEVARLLAGLDWQILPVEADRSGLPGFLPTWPAHQDFDTVFTAYQRLYPGSTVSQDDVSLMVVWLSGRIPYSDDDEIESISSDETGDNSSVG
jgi:hypothetical protein